MKFFLKRTNFIKDPTGKKKEGPNGINRYP